MRSTFLHFCECWRTAPVLESAGGCISLGAEVRNSSRVLLVDDYEPYRVYLRRKLQSWPGLKIVGEASDGLQAVQKAEKLRPDLILLDIGLPTLNGIEAARRISRVVPTAKILFVSQNNDADIVATALSTGAKGYVRKDILAIDIVPAVEAALRGDQFVSRGLRTTELPQTKPDC